MSTQKDSTRLLRRVVGEMIQSLVNDDWVQMNLPDGTHYHILGLTVWASHKDIEIEPTKTYPQRATVDSLDSHFIGSQLAAAPPAADYMKRAVEQAEREGVDLQKARELLSGKQQPWIPKDASAAWWEALTHYLHALIIDQIERGDLEMNDWPLDFGLARAKLYLQEFATRYERAVDRGGTFEALPFANPQLEEASRCYLYGFYRAAVTVAASALEATLKVRLQIRRADKYDTLVNDAWAAGLLGNDTALKESAGHIFVMRNNVVHEGWAPSRHNAEEAVDLTRRILEHLHNLGRSDAQP
jgi:hypothetical protein